MRALSTPLCQSVHSILWKFSVFFATPCSNVGTFTQLQGTRRHCEFLPVLHCLRGDAFGFWFQNCDSVNVNAVVRLLPNGWLVHVACYCTRC